MAKNFNGERKSVSPARTIASPNMVRGLTSFKKAAAQAMDGSGTPSGGATGSNTPGGFLGSPGSLNFSN